MTGVDQSYHVMIYRKIVRLIIEQIGKKIIGGQATIIFQYVMIQYL